MVQGGRSLDSVTIQTGRVAVAILRGSRDELVARLRNRLDRGGAELVVEFVLAGTSRPIILTPEGEGYLLHEVGGWLLEKGNEDFLPHGIGELHEALCEAPQQHG